MIVPMLKKENIKDIYKLSPMQEGLFFHALREKQSHVYFMQISFDIVGSPDMELVKDTWQQLFKRHDILRTVFIYKKVDVPLQVVLKHVEAPCNFIDLSGLPVKELEREIERIKAEDREKGFDLSKEVLMRMMILKRRFDRYMLVWSYHHIILDGWSMGLIMNEFMEIYHQLKRGLDLQMPPAAPYCTYIKWLENREKNTSFNYWKSYLDGFDICTSLPKKPEHNGITSAEYHRLLFSFDSVLSTKLTNFVQQHQYTTGVILQVVWGILLQRFNDTDDVVFGTVVSGRPLDIRDVERIPGPFINTIPFRIRYDRSVLLREVLESAKRASVDSLPYQHYPLAELQAQLKRKEPLFDHIVLVNNYPLDRTLAKTTEDKSQNGFIVENVDSFEQTHYSLTIIIMPFEPITVEITYDQNLYSKSLIENLKDYFLSILGQVLKDVNQPIGSIGDFSANRRDKLLRHYGSIMEASSNISGVGEALEGILSGKRDYVLCLKDGQKFTGGDAVSLVEKVYNKIISGGLLQKLSAIGCYTRSPNMLLIGIVLAHRLHLQFHYIPHSGESRLPEGLKDNFSGALLAEREFPVEGETSFEVDEEICLYMQGEVKEILPYPYVIYNSHRVGFPFCSGVSEENLFVSAINIARKLSVTEQANIVMITDMMDDISLAFLLAVVYARGRINFIGTEDISSIREIENTCVTHLFFAIDRRNLLVDCLTRFRKDGHTPLIVIPYEFITPKIFDTVEQFEECPVYSIYGSFGEGFLIKEDISNGSISCLGLPAANNFCFALDSAGGVVPIGAKGSLFLKNAGSSLYPLSDKKRKNSWLAVNPLWIEHSLYPSGLKGSENEDGSFSLYKDNVCFFKGKTLIGEDLEIQLVKKFRLRDCKVFTNISFADKPVLIIIYVPKYPLSETSFEGYVREIAGPFYEMVQIQRLPYFPLKEDGQFQLKELKDLCDFIMVIWNFQQLKRREEVEGTKFKILISDKRPDNRFSQFETSNIPKIIPLAGEEWQPKVIIPDGEGTALLECEKVSAIPENRQTLVMALEQASKGMQGIIYYDSNGINSELSYKELLVKAKYVLGSLQERGVRPGDNVILYMNENFTRSICIFWACILGGILPLNISPKRGTSKLKSAVSTLGNPYIIVDNYHMEHWPELEGEIGKPLKLLVPDQIEGSVIAGEIYEASPGDVALLQLSSGSTSAPKCISLTHNNILSHVYAEVMLNSFDSSEKTLNWISFDHVVPVMCHLRDVVLEYVQVQVENTLILGQPLMWLNLIEQHGITRTWAPNFAFRLVNMELKKNCTRKWNLCRLKSIMNAGEQVTSSTILEFSQLLEESQLRPQVIQPAYGLAESSTCVTYKSLDQDVEILDLSHWGAGQRLLASVVEAGTVIPGSAIGIFGKDGELLSEGVMGQVCIKGPVVMSGYYNGPADDRTITVDGWLRTGDLGLIHQNKLFIMGRAKETIIVNGIHYSCYEIEDLVNAHAGVRQGYVAVVGIKELSSEEEGVAILFKTQDGGLLENLDLIAAIRRDVTEAFGIIPKIVLPVDETEFLRTSSGKIQRMVMANRLCQGQWNATLEKLGDSSRNDSTLAGLLHCKHWVPKKLNNGYFKVRENGYLIFYQRKEELGDICNLLQGQGSSVFAVEIGIQSINEIFHRLTELKFQVDVVICTQGFYDSFSIESDAEEIINLARKNVFFIVELVKHLKQYRNSPSEIYWVTRGAQRVDEKPIEFTKGFISGILRTLREEWPQCSIKHIDFTDEMAVHSFGKIVLQEIMSNISDDEVAYHPSGRLVPSLKEVEINETLMDIELPINKGGFYVVSGGLGQLGRACIEYLIKDFDAKILIVGRTNLEWDNTENSLEKREILRQLKLQGGYVEYAPVDVSDFEVLNETVAKMKELWSCSLSGVIHLAGVYYEGTLLEKSEEEIFTQMLKAKIIGALNLYKLIMNESDTLFINFSSVNGLMGGINAGFYAAVNHVLDEYMYSVHSRGTCRVKNFSWSKWSSQPQRTETWFVNLSKEQAINAMGLALKLDLPHIIIGLNGRHPKISSLQICRNLKQKELIFVSRSGYIEKSIQSMSETMRRKVIENQWSVSAATVDGLDQQMLSQPLKKSEIIKFRSSKADQPRNELEAKMLKIWKEVLEIDEIGIFDNFFSLGGHSIKVIQIHSKLLKMKDNIPFNALEKYPTIAEFTEKVLGGESPLLNASIIESMNTRHEGKSNLFLLHPAVGEVVSYQRAGYYMEGEVNLYAIQAKGLYNPNIQLDSSVEQIAKNYMEEILKVQPNGDFYIGAYSLSVHIGFELVKMLEKEGQRVARYLILDNGPHEKAYTPTQIEEKVDNILRGVFEKVLKISVWDQIGYMNEALLDEVYRKYGDENNLINHIQKSYFTRFIEVVRNLYICVMNYRIQGRVNADFTYFVTEDKKGSTTCDCWEQFTSGSCILDFLEGTHTSILVEPDCRPMAYKLMKHVLPHGRHLSGNQIN